VKLVPSVERGLGTATGAVPFTMVIGSWLVKTLTGAGPAVLELVANALEKATVPKSASGSVPSDHGASTIHSAELRLALPDVLAIWKVQCFVLSVSVSKNCFLLVYWTSAVMESRGDTA